MLKRCSVVPFFLAVIAAARVFLQSRTDMAVEILALRQQVAVLKRRRPKPPLHPLDRLFWTVLRATWSRWKDALFIVKPETVVGWHRAGFQLYWRILQGRKAAVNSLPSAYETSSYRCSWVGASKSAGLVNHGRSHR